MKNLFSKLKQHKYFLPYQIRWLRDESPLKIMEKSRQVGITYVDAYDSVTKAALKNCRANIWVSSRDELTAREYLNTCKHWAKVLNIAAEDLGEQIIEHEKDLTAHVLRFATGNSIYSLSSNPDTLVGKTGHIKLDEFAVHKNQRDLFRYAKPCTTWGGQLSIISTHRGHDSVFNEILTGIKEKGNPMGFSHHRVTVHDAVNEGLVDKINKKVGRDSVEPRFKSRQDFIARLRAECIDEEQWLQEYCCTPCDESTVFLTHDLLNAAEAPGCMKTLSYLETAENPLYAGVDVGRKKHLCVIDVGEKIGDVLWDRYRIELQDKPFSEIEEELWRVLRLPKLQRVCIDSTGLGMQLAERAKYEFNWKVEPINFTATLKEELAFGLRMAFEDRLLRIDPNPALRSDLRGIKKQITSAGNIRFVGEAEDDGRHANGHCDRFWAKALRQHAAKQRREFFAIVID